KENLETSGRTEESADRSVRVTVAPNGALTNLTIEDSAMRRSGDELAAQIMELTREARRAAAANVTEAFAPLVGVDPEPPRTRPAPVRSGQPADDEDFSNDQVFGRDDDA